jgi:hypothetical protein
LLTWTNQDSITAVARSQGVTVTWSGAAPSSFVVITGSPSTTNPSVSVSFFCTERGEAGTFTVPPEVLSLLPATTATAGGNLSLFNSPIYNQALALTAPGLDAGVFTYLNSISKTVTYQ